MFGYIRGSGPGLVMMFQKHSSTQLQVIRHKGGVIMEGKWTLNHGCHRGTVMSRDTGQPSTHDTEDEALEAYRGHRSFYHSIGYQIWFANLTSPTGEKRTLESNPYR